MTALVADFGLARVLKPIDRQGLDNGGRSYEKKRCVSVLCLEYGLEFIVSYFQDDSSGHSLLDGSRDAAW